MDVMTTEDLIMKDEAMALYDGADRVVSSMEFWEMEKARPKSDKHLRTGLPILDEKIQNIETGELTVISGPTGMGKTLLCDTIMRCFRESNEFSLFFSFEVSPGKIAEKHSTPESVIFLPLQHKAMDLQWLKARCWEAKNKYGCSAVFIDHLHYIIDMSSRNNMSLEIGQTMRFLKKEIALNLHLAVFVVCHVGKLNLETEPSIFHLRDSSFVAQEADNVWMVWRRKDRESSGKKLGSMLQGLATIKVEKARRTGVMGLKINVEKDGHRLIESFDQNTEGL